MMGLAVVPGSERVMGCKSSQGSWPASLARYSALSAPAASSQLVAICPGALYPGMEVSCWGGVAAAGEKEVITSRVGSEGQRSRHKRAAGEQACEAHFVGKRKGNVLKMNQKRWKNSKFPRNFLAIYRNLIQKKKSLHESTERNTRAH